MEVCIEAKEGDECRMGSECRIVVVKCIRVEIYVSVTEEWTEVKESRRIEGTKGSGSPYKWAMLKDTAACLALDILCSATLLRCCDESGRDGFDAVETGVSWQERRTTTDDED